MDVTTVAVDPRASIADFVPEVTTVDKGGMCSRSPARAGSGYTIQLAIPDTASPVRRVELRYDPEGELAYYADERGDLVATVVGPDGGPPEPGEPVRMVPPEGRRTSIHINLASGHGIATNDGGGEEAQTVAGSADELLHARQLGPPAHLIEMIERRCRAE